jgi:transcription elongation GreA/GreB family factor
MTENNHTARRRAGRLIGEGSVSVAFRRESDEEHLEPRFELPLPAGPNLVTARGLAQIEARVAALEAGIAAIADAEARKPVLRDLRYWRTRLATAEPVPPANGEEAAIGTRVRFTLAGKERTITIVGHDEAEPETGLIAFSAPLARALTGLMAGETADFGGRTDAIEVISIEAV